MKIVLLFVILTTSIQDISSAKILCVFPTPSISHQVFFQTIWRALAERNHEVTVITTDPLKDPSLRNLTEIDVSFLYEIFRKIPLQELMSSEKSRLRKLVDTTDFILTILDEQIKSEEVRELLGDESRKFDLIIIESFYYPLYGLSCKYNVPIIGIASLEAMYPVQLTIGNPTHPILYKDILLEYVDEINFWQRLDATVYYLLSLYNYHTYLLPLSQEMGEKWFGNDLPDLREVLRNVSLQMVSTNPIFAEIRPNVPAMIELSFVHVKPSKPLPKDLKDILDEAQEGVVYFSLGSNVKSVLLSDEMKTVIKSALSELPFTVLWKWEDDHMKDKPNNVVLRKWLPQPDLLAHPNVKAFVTQGGLQSAEETVFAGVPVVVIPFFADQPKIAARFQRFGMGIALDKDTMTEETLRKAIMTVAADPEYKRRAEEIRDIVRDQPIKSLDKAVWWIEYVIKYKGARHLRSPSVDIPVYQYLLLDTLGFLLAALLIASYVSYKFTTVIIKCFSRYSKIKTS